MTAIATAFVALMPETTGFGPAVEREVGGQVKGVGKRTGAVFGRAFALGGSLLAAAGIKTFLTGSLDEAREAQKVGARTANVIKTTGGIANISAAQVGKLSTAISNKAAIDDEAVQAGSNLLLTFKNIRNEAGRGNKVFNLATKAAVDLSAAGFGALDGTSKQLGKALNDPIKGITALARSGVTFTDGQKKLIEGFVKSNDLLSAQKIILREVNSQVGGAAAAQATAGERAKVAIGNLKEAVGLKIVAPVVDKLSTAFLKLAPAISRGIDGIGPAFSRLAPVINPVTAALARVGDFIKNNKTVVAVFVGTIVGLTTAFAALNLVLAINPIGLIVIAIAGLAAGLVYAYKQSETFRGIVDGAFGFLRDTALPILKQVAAQVASNLRPVLEQLGETFRAKIVPAAQQAFAAFQRAQSTIAKVATFVLKVVGAGAKLGSKIAGVVLPVLIRFAGFLLSKAVPATIQLIGATVRAVSALITFGRRVVNAAQSVAEFAAKVGRKVAEVVRFFTGLPGRITAALRSLPGTLKTIGGNIVDGLVRGIRAAAGRVVAAVKSLTDRIPKKIREVMGIASPSKVTTKLGGQIGDGLAKGITDKQKAARAAAKRLVDGVRDTLRDRLSGLRDDFASLSDSVSSNLTGNLFGDITTGTGLIANLTSVKGSLGALLGAFKTLRGFGLPSAFLAQLFADGGAPLILDLASNKDQATAAASIFGDIQSLSSNLGDAVAKDRLGDKIDETNAQLAKLVSLQGAAAVAFAKEINSAATAGKKRGNKGKGKK